MKTEPVSPNSGAQRVVNDNKESGDETLDQVDPYPLNTGTDNDQINATVPGNSTITSTRSDAPINSIITTEPTTPSASTTSRRTTKSTSTRTPTPTPSTPSTTPPSSTTPTSKVPKTPLFKTLTPIQKQTRKRKLSTIKTKLEQKSVPELTDLYNSTTDVDFKTLMTECYHENCMDWLEGWEERL